MLNIYAVSGTMPQNMSLPHTPDRFDMPFASDDSVRMLIDATRDWTTNHGFVNFQGEVYGMASEKDGGLLVPTRLMLGTGPTSYSTEVKAERVTEAAPRAAGVLCIKNSVLIQYDEAYYATRSKSAGQAETRQTFVAPRAQFYLRPDNNEHAVTGRRFSMTTQPDGTVISSFYQQGVPTTALDGSKHDEIKIHEQAAMLEIVQGLGALARAKFPGSRSHLW
jgi:hypothetical protein